MVNGLPWFLFAAAIHQRLDLNLKNIIFVHQSAELYGSDKVLLLLCSEMVKEGTYHPIVIVPEEGPLIAQLEANQVEVHVAEVSKISRAVFTPVGLCKLMVSLFHGCRDINRILAGRKVTLVHSNTLAVLSGAIWSFFYRKKHIWHVHEIILAPKIVSKIFPRLVSFFSDLSIANSSLTEKWLLEEQPRLKPRSVVIFNGLPEAPKPAEEKIAAFRHDVGASAEDKIISLVGRISNWKGQFLLLDALGILKQQSKLVGVKVAIVGDTAPGKEFLLEELQQKIAVLELQSVVSHISFVNDVWPVWYGSDIAVVPSTEPEPFGMVAIEAMSAGTPVIAAGHGGLLDIIEHQKSGLLFEPRNANALADAVAQLLASPDLAAEIAHAAKLRQASCFSLAAQVKSTIAAYQQVEAS